MLSNVRGQKRVNMATCSAEVDRVCNDVLEIAEEAVLGVIEEFVDADDDRKNDNFGFYV